ncbi:MAG: hypothetical protein GY754_12210 [bacterium]|nr:hypothetical protein [bacterium]
MMISITLFSICMLLAVFLTMACGEGIAFIFDDKISNDINDDIDPA